MTLLGGSEFRFHKNKVGKNEPFGQVGFHKMFQARLFFIQSILEPLQLILLGL